MAIFHIVCVNGTQVGEALDTVEDAETAMSRLAEDGVSGRSLSVETYDQVPGHPPVAATPYYANGRWHDTYPESLPRAA